MLEINFAKRRPPPANPPASSGAVTHGDERMNSYPLTRQTKQNANMATAHASACQRSALARKAPHSANNTPASDSCTPKACATSDEPGKSADENIRGPDPVARAKPITDNVEKAVRGCRVRAQRTQLKMIPPSKNANKTTNRVPNIT